MPVAGLERKTNPLLVDLILELRKAGALNQAPIWSDIADRLSSSNRLWAQVNLDKVSSVCQPNEVALVPGKVLSTGDPTRALKVAAFAFSENARAKIVKAGGQCLTITDILKSAPKGQGVRIVA